MVDLLPRLDELTAAGSAREMRLVSGPQGARVVLDGRPVLVLCSDNCLGLADHPRVREAAADAALRWGVGAGASRLASGTMTVHRALEERLAAFHGSASSLLFGSCTELYSGVVGALARPGDAVFCDRDSHPAALQGCRLAGAEVFVYDHCDPEHLGWGLDRAQGRGALIVTEGVFGLDGDVAPLAEIAGLARAAGARLLVDEGHATGALGPGGRGAAAEAGIGDEVDVLVGSLGGALGASGAYVCGDDTLIRYLGMAVPAMGWSTAAPPPVAAGALAALDLLIEQPRRVDKLHANAAALRDALAREGFETCGASTHIVALLVGAAALAARVAENALDAGVFAQAIDPPGSPAGAARLRLAAMATHTRSELRDAARVLCDAALRAGFRPGAGLPVAASGRYSLAA